jgi:DNA-binding transcriptional MocR family regulator
MELETVELKPDHLYMDVAERIEKLIEKKALKIGDKLLSVRALSKEQGISLSTAFQAYYYLESKGLIEARPQSGYYVKVSPQHSFEVPNCCTPIDEALPVTLDDMISSVYNDLRSEKIISFALGAPHHSLLPSAKIKKSVMHVMNNTRDHCLDYEHIQGNVLLRKQIARQSFNWGGTASEEDVVITAGCMEAISFCLQSTTKPGDAVATESPTFYGIFRVMQSLGLKVVEVPSDPTTGIDLNYLSQAITKFNIKACVFVCNFNNPTGNSIPDIYKKQLVELLAKKDIPLIEDDIYGELFFGKERPKTCKSFDRKGLVLQCASISKSLAPGFRIGWTIPGKFKEKVIRLKRMHNIATNTLAQASIAHFLQNGRYELHLRHLRKALHTQSLRYVQSITDYFPDDIRMSRPQGGFTLWVEMNKNADGYKLHKKALKHNIGIAPGQIFSSQGQFHNYFRLSFGLPWSDKVEQGIKTLGELVKKF